MIGDPSEETEEAASGNPIEGANLSVDERQARFGVVVLRALAAQAGVGITETSVGEDVLAMDATLEYDESGVRVQVKTTRTSDMSMTKADIRYPAKPAWIEKWAKNKNPCYFVVVVVPGDSANWLDHVEVGTMLSGIAAYWVRIDVAALRAQPTVIVPKANRMSAQTLSTWHNHLVAPYGGS